jgi:hypothetical protein
MASKTPSAYQDIGLLDFSKNQFDHFFAIKYLSPALERRHQLLANVGKAIDFSWRNYASLAVSCA